MHYGNGCNDIYELGMVLLSVFIVDYNLSVVYTWRDAVKYVCGILYNPVVLNGLLKFISRNCLAPFI